MNDKHDPAEPGWDLTQPIDMTSVHVDDEFIDALSQDLPVPTHDDTEYQLAELLSGWRHETLTAPLPELPTVDEVEAAIAATERARRGRGVIRHLRVASGAAAIVVIAGAGLTVLAEGSSPGDPLWGVKRVVFSEAASQTQASMDVQSNLEKAEAAMAAGDPEQAAELIAKAQKDLGPVRDNETLNRMKDWIERLRAQTATSGASSTSASISVSQSQRPSEGAGGPTTPPRDLRRSRVDDGSSSVTVTKPAPPPPVTSDVPTSDGGHQSPGNPEPSTPPDVRDTTPSTTATSSPVERNDGAGGQQSGFPTTTSPSS
ncbi:anti-sigma-D factor RsdA [Gordonia sp. SL306]|uniref:anti-sigma-D factor RsdA n=1 Tax=Gordonia sp. SL306 TaxID=2995145 RepID=UPI00226E0AE9|nr:anti-sigma-D factor RsdA [Gordonia sp. SL306]WAC54734.1 anti-sigma-D factor RsdA [Gordonia sp. SL306]